MIIHQAMGLLFCYGMGFAIANAVCLILPGDTAAIGTRVCGMRVGVAVALPGALMILWSV